MTLSNSVKGARHRQSLKFTLGDYCFWQFGFDATVIDPPLGRILEGAGSEATPAGRTAADIQVVRALRTNIRLPRLRFADSYLHYVPSQEQRYYIEFGGSFKEYLSKFSKKSRGNWQRKVRKFTEESGGTIDWRKYHSPDELSEFHKLAADLSRKTYQEKIFGEGFATAAGPLERYAALAARGSIRGYMLFFQGRPVAYIFCHCADDMIRYSIVGYDQSCGELRPGDVLLYLLIEALHAEGSFRYLDFGEGAAWYKEFYSTNSVSCARVYRFPIRVKYVVAVGLHAAMNVATDMVGALLDWLSLRQRLRRILRGTATPNTQSE